MKSYESYEVPRNLIQFKGNLMKSCEILNKYRWKSWKSLEIFGNQIKLLKIILSHRKSF